MFFVMELLGILKNKERNMNQDSLFEHIKSNPKLMILVSSLITISTIGIIAILMNVFERKLEARILSFEL